MDDSGLDFVNAIPKQTPGERLFAPRDPGTALAGSSARWRS
jgi:hypothetical protein